MWLARELKSTSRIREGINAGVRSSMVTLSLSATLLWLLHPQDKGARENLFSPCLSLLQPMLCPGDPVAFSQVGCNFFYVFQSLSYFLMYLAGWPLSFCPLISTGSPWTPPVAEQPGAMVCLPPPRTGCMEPRLKSLRTTHIPFFAWFSKATVCCSHASCLFVFLPSVCQSPTELLEPMTSFK